MPLNGQFQKELYTVSKEKSVSDDESSYTCLNLDKRKEAVHDETD